MSDEIKEMWMFMFKNCSKILPLVCLLGCCPPSDISETPTKRYENVVRVFYAHHRIHIATEDPTTKQIKFDYFGTSSTKIFADAPLAEPMWAEENDGYTVIHIHAPNVIKGGSYTDDDTTYYIQEIH